MEFAVLSWPELNGLIEHGVFPVELGPHPFVQVPIEAHGGLGATGTEFIGVGQLVWPRRENNIADVQV